MDFVTDVYRLTQNFPREELYGLTSQLRRSAVSIVSNIAEGQGRGTPQEFRHFISMALGSLMEAETQILIAQRLSYVSQPECDQLLTQSHEVGRLLGGLFKSDLKPRKSPGEQ